MNFLNQAAAQIRDLFRSMTPGARITAGLLLAMVVVSVFWLFRAQSSGPDAYLMGGEPFSANDLPAMEAAFAKANLSNYEIDGNRVRIPRGMQASYMGALADSGALPPNFGSYLEKAMAADNPFLGAKDKQERLKIAKQNELALILRSMQGIENAAVIYDIKKEAGIGRKDTVTASVNIKPRGSEPMSADRIPMIRNLVAASIAGLQRENVTVTDLNGRTYAGVGSDGMGDPMDDPYYKLKMNFEKEKRQQIAEALAMIPGVNVQVNAELDTELRHRRESVKYDPKAVVVSSDTKTETENMKGNSPGGRPGLESQKQSAQGPGGGAATLSAQSGRTNSKELERTSEKQESAVSTDRETVELKGLTPKRVQVSVVIPSDYYRQVWQSTNPAAAGGAPKDPAAVDLSNLEQKIRKDVESIVVQLLPPPATKGDDPFPRVTVTTLQSLPMTPLAEPTMAKEAVAWVGQYWSTLGMTGLAFFSLLMLRSMVKATPAPPAPTPFASATPVSPTLTLVSDEEPSDENSSEPAANRLKRRIRKGPSLKDDLSEMVREDPDAAASILRNWINNAS